MRRAGRSGKFGMGWLRGTEGQEEQRWRRACKGVENRKSETALVERWKGGGGRLARTMEKCGCAGKEALENKRTV